MEIAKFERFCVVLKLEFEVKKKMEDAHQTVAQ